MEGKELIQIVDDFNAGKTVRIKGSSFKRSANSWSFNQAIAEAPIKYGVKSITVPLCSHEDYIGNKDLDSRIHKGFTIGKGKTMYWYITWHKSGHATVYREEQDGLVKRRVSGDSMITIHFKNK